MITFIHDRCVMLLHELLCVIGDIPAIIKTILICILHVTVNTNTTIGWSHPDIGQ